MWGFPPRIVNLFPLVHSFCKRHARRAGTPYEWWSAIVLSGKFILLVSREANKQEKWIEDNEGIALQGYETENIRFGYGADSDAPVALKVNPSLDPFMRFNILFMLSLNVHPWLNA